MNKSLRIWIMEHPLLSFFVLSFVFAWGVWIITGLLNPGLLPAMALVGAWSPTLSALLITGVIKGKSGVSDLLKRGLQWRVSVKWYLIAFFSIAIIGLAGIGIHTALGGEMPRPALPGGMPVDQLYLFLPVIYLINIFIGGPIAEEFGWRGFALPRLQSSIGAAWAAIVIGIIWGVWHLPFFLFPDAGLVVGNIPFGFYLPLVTAWSVLFAWIYNNTRGSVLLMILFHAAINTTLGSLGLANSLSGGFQLLIINLILTWIAVGVVILVFGPSQLTRKEGIKT
jgi:membrane protease YdiL (CAAX protease family)